jgi:hypothetical protein
MPVRLPRLNSLEEWSRRMRLAIMVEATDGAVDCVVEIIGIDQGAAGGPAAHSTARSYAGRRRLPPV